MRTLRARRAKIVPVPALVDRKTDAGLKMDADLKVDAGRKMGVAPKAGVVPKVDVAPKVDAAPKADAAPKVDVALKAVAVLKADAVLKTDAVVPDDVRSRAWSSLSVRWFPAARLTRRGSRLQAFQFGRLRLQNHVAALVAKAPVDQAVRVDPVDQPALAAVRLRVVIANFATRGTRGHHTSKFFTSSACFSM